MEFRAEQMSLCLLSVFVVCAVADHHAPEVHTKLGSLRGEYLSVRGTETRVHAFLGVPFAKPPIGPALRLAAPQPVEGWEGMKDATKQPPMCVQNKEFFTYILPFFGTTLRELPDISEDCLYLNIYTPANRAQNAKLPVMVWIHGGGFIMGSASQYDGSALAAYQDVVVVLIQYRLGFLGFLSTGDEHLSGNFGLLDQVQALRWIKEHIHNFGGDSDLVTIFGESAGGMSVSLLLLSPLSDGLFHRAIAESGTATLDLLVVDDPLPLTQAIASVSGCSLESSKEFADCMKNLDFNTIETLAKEKRVANPLTIDGHSLKNKRVANAITIDGHFLPKPVNELFHKHELHSVPFMTGANDDEGGWFLGHFFARTNWTEEMDREEIMTFLSMFYPDPKDAVIKDLILDEYTGTGEDRVKNREGFTEFLGDVFFIIPAITAANAHRDAGAPVYLYQFQHRPSFLRDKRPSFVGSDHVDEIFAVLGSCFSTSDVQLIGACTEEDERLSKIMMNYWGNFARTGFPNGKGLAHWPKYEAGEEYLKIAAKEQTADRYLKKERYVFWTQTFPEKVRQSREKQHSEL